MSGAAVSHSLLSVGHSAWNQLAYENSCQIQDLFLVLRVQRTSGDLELQTIQRVVVIKYLLQQ